MFDSRSSSGSGVYPPPVVGMGFDLGVCIRELDLHHGSLLDGVAVRVDRLENAFRQIFLDRSAKLGHEKREEDRQLLTLALGWRESMTEIPSVAGV